MTSDADFIVSAAELKKVGFCYSGQWDWFKRQGLDMKQHLECGTPASVLLATGDGFGARAVALVKALRNG